MREFTRDGAWIFFEVARPAGVLQIWRMRADGSGLQQHTSDEDDIDTCSPSPSPDGARFAYVLRYPNRIVNSHFIAVRDIVTGAVDTITSSVDNHQFTGGVRRWPPGLRRGSGPRARELVR